MSKISLSFFPYYFLIIPAIAAIQPPSSDFCSTSQSQQRNIHHLQKKEDRFNNVYNSDGEPGPFSDMEDIEDTKYFDEYALLDVPPPNSGKSQIMKVMNLLRKEWTSQIMIYLIQ